MSTRSAILDFFADRSIFADDDLLGDLTNECDGLDAGSVGTYLERRGFENEA